MNNRMYNCKNPHQGKTKKVLCVCSAGLLRSPTAAKLIGEKYGWNTRSCGVDVGHALIPIDDVLVTWADEIVCMDSKQAKVVEEIMERLNAQDKDLFSLNIPDNYAFGDPKLIALIDKQYQDALQIWKNMDAN